MRRVAIVALPIAGAGAGGAAGRRGGRRATIEQSTEVGVPVHTAYNQWTQFEEFPRFMEGVEQVQQLDDTRLHWVAQVGGQRREWDATITEQVPDARVAWRSTTGKANGGVVTFQPLDADRTRVTVQMDYQPEGMAESVGSALGLASRRVKSDLERFRELIEARGTANGAWRGEVHDGAAH